MSLPGKRRPKLTVRQLVDTEILAEETGQRLERLARLAGSKSPVGRRALGALWRVLDLERAARRERLERFPESEGPAR